MSLLVAEGLIRLTYRVAVFALEQGIQLFYTKSEEIYQDLKEEKDNNEMDSVSIYNQVRDKGIQRFLNRNDAAENCLKQIEKLHIVSEASDFSTSLDYLSDAWRAFSGNNIPLFKEYISESYKYSRIAKSKITKNCNHLLGVYSIIIFCGFCKFSDFGNNTFLGLKHIKDTLNQMSSTKSLLTNALIKTIESKMYWNKTQKIFMQNIILFSLRMRTFVANIVIYSKQNHNQSEYTQSNDIEKQFGDMMRIIFPNATLTSSDDKQQILDYETWCPNVLNGRYFGGNKDKIFTTIDFWNKIYPLIINDTDELKDLNHIYITFIDVYHKELSQYISTSNVVSDLIKTCIIHDDQHKKSVIKLKKKTKKIALCLALQREINSIANFEREDVLYIPTNVTINSYRNEFDLIFASKYCGIHVLEFDGCDEMGIQRFGKILTYGLCSSLKQVIIGNTPLSSMILNELCRVLNDICIDLNVLHLETLVITYNTNDTFNLHFIPRSIKEFKYNNIKYIHNQEEESLYKFELDYSQDKDKQNRCKSLDIIDLSRTAMNEYNVNQLMAFVGEQCSVMTTLILCNSGINDSFCNILINFYLSNHKHTLCVLQLYNKNCYHNQNVITKDAVHQFTMLMTEILVDRNDVAITFDQQYGTRATIRSNMGQVVWLPVDNICVDSGIHQISKQINTNTPSHSAKESVNDINMDDIKTEIMSSEQYIIDRLCEKKGSGKWDKYKKRRLRLRKDGVLQYYNNDKLSGSIDLNTDEFIAVIGNDKKGKSMHFGWELSTQKRVYYFASANDTERKEWIKQIGCFCHYMASTKSEAFAQIYAEDGVYNQNDNTMNVNQSYPLQQSYQHAQNVSSDPQNEESPLPNGWRKVYTKDHKAYYQNDITQETSWNRPFVVTKDRDIEVKDEEQKQYDGMISNQRSAQPLSDEWKQLYTNDGNIYYQNDITKETRIMPTMNVSSSYATMNSNEELPLPNGWRTMYTNDDKVYYQNDITKETSWNRPTIDTKDADKDKEEERTQYDDMVSNEWQQQYTNDGNVYHQNAITNEIRIIPQKHSQEVMIDPQQYQITQNLENIQNEKIEEDQESPLPYGWRKVYTKDHRLYYQNDITLQTSWERPKRTLALSERVYPIL